jgi:hypothetical protein
MTTVNGLRWLINRVTSKHVYESPLTNVMTNGSNDALHLTISIGKNITYD